MKRNLNVTVQSELVAKIDTLTQQGLIPRSRIVEDLLKLGLECRTNENKGVTA